MKNNLKILSLALFVTLIFSQFAFAKTVDIHFWHALGGDNGKVLEGLIERFNKEQDEVKVNYVWTGNYEQSLQKIMAAIAAGIQPDLAQMEQTYGARLVSAKLLIPAHKIINDLGGLDVTDIAEPFWMNNTYDGEVWSIPFNMSTPVLYYNKEHFKAAGLDPEHAPETWEELASYAKELTIPGKQVGFAYMSTGAQWIFESFVWQNGGQILSADEKQVLLNNQEGVETLKFLVDLVNKDKVAEFIPGDQATEDFKTGRLSMVIQSSASLGPMIRQVGFDMGVAKLPGQKEHAAAMGGANLVFFDTKSSERLEATWKFVQWLLSPDVMADFSLATGYVPVTTSAAQTEKMLTAVAADPRLSVALEQVSVGRARPRLASYAEFQSILGEYVTHAMYGNLTPDKALEQFAKRAGSLVK